jgi:hypothetical protein
LRRLRVLVRHLPRDTDTVRALAGQEPPSTEAVLLAELWSLVDAHVGRRKRARVHPLLKDLRQTQRARAVTSPDRRRALAAARRRQAARRRAIESGEIQ